MAYDEDLAPRVRGRLSGEAGLSERAMFGRLALLLDGNMSVAISGEDLMVRVGDLAGWVRRGVELARSLPAKR